MKQLIWRALMTAMLILLTAVTLTPAQGGKAGIYSLPMLFMDDYRGFDNELQSLERFNPGILLRSWYRWGEPPEKKRYSLRGEALGKLSKRGILLGGGASLSVVNDRDMNRDDFSETWLSTELDGSPVEKKGHFFGSISAPGFRAYLIDRVMEQVDLGVRELHFGETTGDLAYDDWTIGLQGDRGFLQWLTSRFKDRETNWWISEFGDLGRKLHSGEPVLRQDFQTYAGTMPDSLVRHWGKRGSWHGVNDLDEPAFLAWKYQTNLESFISELKARLNRDGYTNVAIDVWGYAKWIEKLSSRPDAIIEGIPGREWGFDWMIDENFNFQQRGSRIRGIMKDVADAMAPVKVVWAIDHPEPFNTFKKLSDRSQARCLKEFAAYCRELKCSFLPRSYIRDQESLGKTTEDALKEIIR